MYQQLTEILPVPTERGGVHPPGYWEELKGEFGISIPGDLREFNRTYGHGHVVSGVSGLRLYPGIFKDNTSNGGSTKRLAMLADELGFIPPMSRAPFGAGGWFAWAGSDTGDLWCYETEGEPESWPIVLVPRSALSQRYYRYHYSATEYLYRLLAREIDDDISRDFRIETVRFVPRL